MISFFLPMKIPSVTSQQKRVCMIGGKPHHYDGARLKAARQEYTLRLLPHKPKEPIAAGIPVKLAVRFVYKARRKKDIGTWKTTRPDTDNMIKLLKDCMTAAGFWHDDAQVVCEHTEKQFGEVEGIYLTVEAIV